MTVCRRFFRRWLPSRADSTLTYGSTRSASYKTRNKDKVEEIQQMSDIFRGALVVVVAASAKSPLESLLEVKPQSDKSHTWRM